MTMAIRDEDLFEAISPCTVRQRRGLECRNVSSVGRHIFWAALAGVALILFIVIPPNALFQ